MKRKMFLDAPAGIFQQAKLLRENMTTHETILWEHLRKNALGYKFRRQHPIKLYIADFYCHAAKLIIEVDGSIHNNSAVHQYDKERQQCLEDEGISFLRFTNSEIEHDLDRVKDVIKHFLLNSGK